MQKPSPQINSNHVKKNKEYKKEIFQRVWTPYLILFLIFVVYFGIAVANADGEFLTALILILGLIIGVPVVGIFVSVIQDEMHLLKRKYDIPSEDTSKIMGWLAAGGLAVFLVFCLKSDPLESARRATAESRSESQRQHFMKKLEDATGKYYDKNCSRSQYGC